MSPCKGRMSRGTTFSYRTNRLYLSSSVTGIPGITYPPAVQHLPHPYTTGNPTPGLQPFSSKATFRTRFPWTASQPVNGPLCQCAVRTPLSHHLLDRSYLNEHNTICQDIFYICCISL